MERGSILMGGFVDRTGQRFGRLKVVERVPRNKNSTHALWLCVCDCGREITCTSGRLQSGNTKSCGCIHKEQLANRNKLNSVHNEGKSRLYGVWHGMKQRCYDSNRIDYPNYGGRGIFVCKEWKDRIVTLISNNGLFLMDMIQKPNI